MSDDVSVYLCTGQSFTCLSGVYIYICSGVYVLLFLTCVISAVNNLNAATTLQSADFW